MELDGTVAVVTGAGGNLGSVVTTHLLRAGAHVVAVEHTQEKLDDLLGRLPTDASLTPIVCNVVEQHGVSEMMNRVHDDLGGPDALLNLVGGFAGGETVAQTDLETWRRMMDLNLTSMFLCTKHALRYMLEADRGRIVSVSSKAAEDLPAGRAAYACAKAGVLNLTACIAKEVADTGVAVAAVMPSIIDTPVTREARPDADCSRWVTPQQIAGVLAWLISDEAGVVNGSVLRLYGELT
ncbi:MAG: SDR family NAD(P)-dependent oxidoreductase [Armatimonadota bacterium]